MQRPEAKNPPKRPSISAETGNLKMGVKNPRRNGLFAVDVEICGFGRLDGGRDRDRTCDPLDVNEVLSLVSPSARPKNRRRSAAYAAYDFVVSYAICPVISASGTRLGPEKTSVGRP